jgi:chromosome segregation ATPase
LVNQEARSMTDEHKERIGLGQVPYSAPIEDRVEKWKREMGELEAAREAERERMSSHTRKLSELRGMIARSDQALSQALAAINKMAEALTERLDEMSEEIRQLRAKLEIAEARFEDLKRSVDAQRPDVAPAAKLYDPPNPGAIPRARRVS